MNDLADEIEDAGGRAGDAGDELDDLAESEREAGRGAREASGPTNDLKEAIKGLITLAAAKELLDLNDRLTGLKRGFEAVLGSSAAANESLGFVRETADRLGTNALDLAQSFLKITAAAKGTQLEGAPTEKIFSGIATAMSSVNASADDLERVMEAVGQMMSKGVVSAEELRGQLGDALPGAVQQAAQALLVSNAELSKMLESGEIIASDFLPKFAMQLESAMGGSQKRVEGFNASWTRLVNGLVEVATGPAGKGFTDFMVLIVDKIAVFTRGIGFASDLVGGFSRLLGGLAAGEITAAFADFGQNVTDASVQLMGFKTEAEQAAERQKQMAEETRALTPELDRFQDAVNRGEIKAFPESLQAAITELRKTGDAAEATEQAISKFMGGVEKNLNFDGVIDLATSLKAVGQEAKTAGTTIQETLANSLDKLSDEQLAKLKAEAEAAMAAASRGSEQARKAFADLGLVVDAVANVQLKRAVEESQRVADASGRYTSALAQLANAQLDGIRSEIDLANAKGQTWLASQKSGELAKLEAQWTQTLAAARQLEIAAERASVEAKIAELKARTDQTEAVQKEIAALQLKMQALGQEAEASKLAAQVAAVRQQTAGQTAAQQRQSTQAIQENTVAVKENSAAQEENVKHANDGGAALQALNEYLGQTRAQMIGLSEVAGLLFEKELQVALAHSPVEQSLKNVTAAVVAYNTGVDASQRRLASFAKEISDANALISQSEEKLLFASNGFRQFEAAIEIAAGKAKKAYYEQAEAAETLRLQVEEAGRRGSDQTKILAFAAEQAAHAFNLLDEQNLSALNRSIDEATAKIRALQDEARSARDTLSDMNAEYIAVKGDTAGADRLRLKNEEAQKRRGIEEKLAQAQAASNQELIALYREQLTALGKIYDQKQKNLEQDLREKAQQTPKTPAASGGAGAAVASVAGTTYHITNHNTFQTDPSQLASENWWRSKVQPIQEKVSRLRK